jgi:membrane protein
LAACRVSGREERATEALVADSQSLLVQAESQIADAIAALYRFLDRNRLTRLPWAVVQTFSQAQGALLSGSMAYYTFLSLLSLLPLLMVAVFVVGTVSQWNAGFQAALVRVAKEIAPGVQGADVLEQVVHARAAFGILGLAAVTYAGSGFVGALTACLNRMWEVQAGRNPLDQKVVNLLVVVLLGVVLLGSVGLTVWVAYLTRAALGSDADPVVGWLDRLATPGSLGVVLLLLYRLLPARRLSWRSQLPGAAFGAVTIELLKRAFQFWAQRSAGVAVLPRSLLSVVLLLVWLGLFGQAILYGAAINVVLERRRRGRRLLPAGVQPAPPARERGLARAAPDQPAVPERAGPDPTP